MRYRNSGLTSRRRSASSMPSSNFPCSPFPASKNVISSSTCSRVDRPRYARRVSGVRIVRAQAASCEAFAGVQLNIRRRLGVSPGPFAPCGPTIVTVEIDGRRPVMPPVPDGAAGFSNGSRTCSTRSGGTLKKVTATSCGPAVTGTRTAGPSRPTGPAFTGAPSIVISSWCRSPPAPPGPPPRSTLISYSASTGNTWRTSVPPRVPSGSRTSRSCCCVSGDTR